ncbi:MAG: hypothetical protein K0R65_628 [Crocinitomicaceae bacterium]|nr:hypothetical protein [Crocinitomicaceae bacterium]
MKNENYLQELLHRYHVEKILLKDGRLDEIKRIVRSWAGNRINTMMLTGSNEKETAIKGQSHGDLLISMKPNTGITLHNLVDSLECEVIKHGFRANKNRSSFSVEVNGLEIGLMPGIFQRGTLNYHEILLPEKRELKKTNIKLHVNTVLESKRQNEIRLLKIWRNCQHLEFPGFYLELMVIKALRNTKEQNLVQNFITVLEFLRDNITEETVIDPANSDSLISDQLTHSEKEYIRERAKASLESKTIEEVIW